MDIIKIKQLAKLTKLLFNCMRIKDFYIPDDNRDPKSNDHPGYIKIDNVFDCMCFDMMISEAYTGEEYQYINDLIQNDLIKFIQDVFIPQLDSNNFAEVVEKRIAKVKS